MRDFEPKLLDRVLRPTRASLERCLRTRDAYVAREKLAEASRVRALADCQARIEAARADVFAAGDGVVAANMTALEREWRRIARRDPDAGLMALWSELVPREWHDRKVWRDSLDAPLDLAIALAADLDGVSDAEAAVRALARALAGFGVVIPSRVRFRLVNVEAEDDPNERDAASEVWSEPVRVALSAASSERGGAYAIERARRREDAMRGEAERRWPSRRGLVRDLGRAELVSALVASKGSAADARLAEVLCAARALWSSGAVLGALDADRVTLDLPELPRLAD